MNHATDESRAHVPIAELVASRFVSVPADLSVEGLEELLLERDLISVPVVDERGRLVGVAGLTDLVRCFDRRAEAATVAQVMSPVAFALPATCPIDKAAHAIAAGAHAMVPVVADDGRLVGVLAAADMIRYLSGAQRAPEHSAERERWTEADRLASLGFLAGGVAHQVNNALTSMRLSLGRLTSFELSRRPITPEVLHRIELLQDVREGVSRIERVIRELRSFSHMDDGPTRAVDVVELLEASVGFAMHQIRHRATLAADYGPVPPVRATPAELRQVFLSLLVNATQAMIDGEAHVNEIRVRTRTDDQGRAVIEISDTGAGIPSDMLDRIFEPFFTTKHTMGLGLGLAVSRDIVTALSGEIAIESEVGQGTTVRVTLPGCAEAAVATTTSDAPRERDDGDDRRRVLIIDDDRPVAAAIALELAAHDVVVAESGREALEILRRDRGFDVILCDLMMPEISGMDVYESLRLIDPGLLRRVVLMTGGAFTARAGQFLAEVDAPLIEKPFEPGQLHAIVNTLERRSGRIAVPDHRPSAATTRKDA